MSENTKQLTVIKTKTTKVLNRANELSVTNQEEFEDAANILSDMKAVMKEAEADRKTITAPLNEALKNVNGRYKPLKDMLTEAEGIIKKKLATYQSEIQAKLDEEEAELRKQMAAGEVTPEEAVSEMENKESIGSSFDTKRGSVQFKKVRKVRVTNVAKVPANYLNDPKVLEAITSVVRQDALDGVKIAGVEVYEDKVVATR